MLWCFMFLDPQGTNFSFTIAILARHCYNKRPPSLGLASTLLNLN